MNTPPTSRFFLRALPGLVCALLLGSCIAHIGVTKVDNSSPEGAAKARGVRYSLPQPFVVGRPSGDGKVSYTIEYLPDPTNEYAVNAWSFMAKHKLELKRSPKGLLLSAEYSKDDTTVAKSLVDSAGNVAEKIITAQGGSGGGSKAADGTSRNVTTVVPDLKTVPGPVIYRVVEDEVVGVRLVPVDFQVMLNGRLHRDTQHDFQTIGTKPAAPAPGGTTGDPKLTSAAELQIINNSDPGKSVTYSATFDQPVELVPASCLLVLVDGNKNKSALMKVEHDADKTPAVVKVTILKRTEDGSATLESGDYSLVIGVKMKDKPDAKIVKPTVSVHVRN